MSEFKQTWWDMSEFKQTWWDNNINNRYEEFASWVGDSNSLSKVFFRNYIKEKKYTSFYLVNH
jgi:hypothetical protein